MNDTGLGMERRGQMWVLLIVLGLLFLAIPLTSNNVQANPFTTVTLSLEGDPPIVDVSPGSSGMVTIEGWVTCVKYGPDSVKVSLFAESDTGSASIVPPNFVFTGSSGTEQTESFSMSTRVPTGYPCKANPSITVSGYWDQGGLRTNIAPVSQIIIIEQYYQIEAFCPEGNLRTVKPGEELDLAVNILNHGNGEDTFFIDIENRLHLFDKGFRMSDPVETTMCEDETRVVILQVTVPEKTSGNQSIHLLIESKGSQSSGSPCESRIMVNLQIESGNTTEDKPISEEILSNEYSFRLIIISLILTSISITVAIIKRRRRAAHLF
jgi:hypothetical protein